MPDAIIAVRNLSKRYTRGPDRVLRLREALAAITWAPYRRLRGRAAPVTPRRETFWALRNLTFDVARGERVGIIGRNGAGKSTLLKILSRIVYPTEGEVRLRGRVTPLLEVGTGFSPDLTGRENIYLNASLHGLDRHEIDARFEDIVEFSGVRDFLETPVRHYSSGMFMRLAFSVAAHLDPDILLLDEVLAVGDLAFQQKCLNRVEGLTSEGRTVLFVSHSMEAIARFCDRCLWLDQGRIVRDGRASDVIDAYLEALFAVQGSRQWVTEDARPDAPRETTTAVPAEESAETTHRSVRLVSARIVNDEGATITSVTVDRPVGIEVVYDILEEGQNIQPALHVKTREEAYAFVVAYTDPVYMHRALPRGRYAATAWIPAHMLNTGLMYVTILMQIPDPLEPLCVAERALSFHVFESLDTAARSARGLYARDFPGLVRPLLTWDTRSVGDGQADDTDPVRQSSMPASRRNVAVSLSPGEARSRD